jgi:Helix-turn-helix domain
MDTTIETLRAELERARQAARAGDVATVLRELDQAVAALDADRLLTTTEAAHLLGIRSPNTVLAWCRTGYIQGAKRGGRTLIPLAEIERIRDGDPVRAHKAADQLHDRAAPLGADLPMNEAEMELLHGARPGKLPWERSPEPAE